VETWIAKHLTGEATPQEETQLQEWIDENPENKKLFVDFKQVMELGKKHYDTNSSISLNIDINSEWNHFLKNVEHNQGLKVIKLNKGSAISRNNWLKIAASVVLIASVGLLINYFSTRSSLIQYQTAQNTQEIVLPDGSVVTLNKNTSLSYAESFGEADRSLNLIGEAFFEVTKNKTSPFIISTKKTQIQVLGTSFNVRDFGQSDDAEVTVATGLVKFAKNNSNEAITLKAGDKGILRLNRLVSKVITDVNYLSWKTGKIVFEEQSLKSVIETLNRVYQVNIFSKFELPETCQITVTFEQQTIEAVLNVLKTTLDLNYLINGDQIEFTSIGC